MDNTVETTEVTETTESKPDFLIRSYTRVKKVVTSTPGKIALAVTGTVGAIAGTYWFGFNAGSDHAVDVMTDFVEAADEDADEDPTSDEDTDTSDSIEE